MIRYEVMGARPQKPVATTPFQRYIFDDGTVWTEFFRSGTGYLLRFPAFADFEVSSNGKEVTAYPAIGSDEATIEHLYVNQLVPLALSRQGQPTFHASVVMVPEGAVAFLGQAGTGKSTLAASFALGESAFLTDDALIIDESDGIRALPSHASVRLWEDSREALIPDDTVATGGVSYSTKARLLAGEALRFADRPAPLLAAFVLDRGDVEDITIEPLTGGDRHMAWINNSFLLDIEDKELLTRHFDWTHRISGRVPTFRLDYPRDYGMLARVRDAVRQQASNLGN